MDITDRLFGVSRMTVRAFADVTKFPAFVP
jgi:hypothetical protein